MDLFDTAEPDEAKRQRLRDRGWAEKLYATRSGIPNRFWKSPDGREMAEYAAFDALAREESGGTDVPRA